MLHLKKREKPAEVSGVDLVIYERGGGSEAFRPPEARETKEFQGHASPEEFEINIMRSAIFRDFDIDVFQIHVKNSTRWVSGVGSWE